MTDKQPALFDWATELSDAQGRVTLSEQEAKEIGARLRSMGEKLKTYEDLDEAASDVQLLRMGYDAARLEIESLRAQSAEPAGEYPALPPDELRTNYLDLLQEVLDAKDVMLAAGCQQNSFGAMFAEYSAPHGQAPAGASYEKELEEALRERDDADDFIDALLDEVLGTDRAEWSSAYGRADALEEVRERITALHKPAVDRAWTRFEAATAQAAPTATPQADSQPARDERDDFEKVFPIPSGCIRVGTGYASIGYSNWAAHTHCERWQGWRARAARAPADSVLEDAAFEAVRKQLCVLPRYSFVLDDDGLIRRVQDRVGNWIEFDDAHALFDPVAVDAARSNGRRH